MKSAALALILTIVAAPSTPFAAKKLGSAGVIVMSRKDVDPTTLKLETYVYVAFRADGIDGVTWGLIKQIDTMAFAKTSQALERWHRWTKSGIVGMTRWDLNPSMLEEGLLVHVGYTSRGARREAVGRIVDSYTDRIVIQQRVGGENSFARPQRLEMAFGDIETVIVSRDQRARTSDLLRNTIIFLHLAH